jgi:hypothetical protein
VGKYNLYIQQHVRKMIQERDVSYDRALQFLSVEYALVMDSDGNKYYTKEELENAYNIRSEPGSPEYNADTSGGSVPESTDRELFKFTPDNTE